MKTKLLIAFLMISCIVFAQKKNKTKLNTHQKITTKNSIKNNNQNESYIKFDEVKDKTNTKSSKKNIKIGGTEKPNATKKGYKYWVNNKMKETKEKNKFTRRRVVIAKSNK